jgi:release factor glutamine methyltransferase
MPLDHAAIRAFHREMHEKFRLTDTGTIDYLGTEFVVHKNVFWPGDDSEPLVSNYRVDQGEDVLDVCTGAGHIAVFSASKGARSVVALDKNPDAVQTAKENAERHGYSDTIEVMESDVFSALEPDSRFDVITMNPPFIDVELEDIVTASTWDEKLHVHREFFAHVKDHLKPGGRCYLAQANFGVVDDMKKMADDAGFDVREIGRHQKPNTELVFYAFELRPV